MHPIQTIDDYIATFPQDIQHILKKIREIIKKSAVSAEETIKYRMPTFMINGHNLVHFAAFKKHIGFYPTPSVITAFQKELASYTYAKGSIQFPVDKPIPYDLIETMVKFRLKEMIK